MNIDVMDDERVCFLNFTFNRKLRTLQRSEEIIQLRKKEADVLALLCDKFPNPVSQNDFLAEVWGGSYVTSQSIAQVIRSLRIILCDDKKNIILTIPKLGYKLAATPAYAESVISRGRSNEPGCINNGQPDAINMTKSAVDIISSYTNFMPLMPFSQRKKKHITAKKLIFSGAIILFGSLAFWTLSFDTCAIGFNKEVCEVDSGAHKKYSPVSEVNSFHAIIEDNAEYRHR